MSYKNDIFVSYAGHKTWTPWVRNKFVPLLEHRLVAQWGKPRMFVDSQIVTGDDWEPVLRYELAHSRLILCLLSPSYFDSDWCRREMAIMLEREAGLAAHRQNRGLVVPIRLGDGDFFPKLISGRHYLDFADFAGFDFSEQCKKFQKFQERTDALACQLATRLSDVPPYSTEWETFTGDAYFPLLARQNRPPDKPPRLEV